ncbi:hypothetical protein [Streptomyces sp. AC555_RSS877]|uniref:hypothetical protein n=1 Tax=Streptomyces sp. AC555_RSS877 TaxID=2823688 RepID=UPI001C26195C|nr:hypothetical protein [Streptomyces sp. AC555_RSS877]
MGRQIALLDALRKLDRPFVVLVQGKPSTLPAPALGADAIVQAFTQGMQASGGRRALARAHRAERAAAGPLPTRSGGSTATGAPI